MHFVDVIMYIGIFVFACTGALKARAHHLDIFGALVLAFVMAYGGGTTRDLLINKNVVWMNDYYALSLVFGAVVIIFLFDKNVNRFRKTMFFTDAVGLGMFTASGIERSLHVGVNEVYAILMGLVSATFGGLIADIISNEVPSLLKKGELYATASAIGGIVFIILGKLHTEHTIKLTVCVILVVTIRIISRKKKLTLPEI